MHVSPYRPRNAGHDYYGRGTYLVTLVVSGRERLLSSFVTGVGGKDLRGRELLVLTPLGEAVQQAWQHTPELQQAHGNKILVHACVCMPDHFHGVIEVLEPMSWSLGDIVQAFKAFCTSHWQQSQGLPSSLNRPISDYCKSPSAPFWLREKAAICASEGALIRALSKKRRQGYYALVGRKQRPPVRRQLRRHRVSRRAPPAGHDSLRPRQPAPRPVAAPAARRAASLPACSSKQITLSDNKQEKTTDMETQLLKLDKPYEIICNQNGRFGLHIATLIVIKEERYRDAKTKQPSEDTYLKTSSYPVVGGGVGIEGKVWMGSELKDCQAVCREGGTAGLYTLKSIMEHCSKVSIFEMLLDIPITFSTSLMIYHAKFELPKDAKKRTINDYVVRLEFTESKNGASCMAYAAKESDFYFYAYFDNEPPFSYPATTNTDAIAFLAELRDVYLLAFRTEGLRSITFTTNDKKYQWFVDKLNSTKADAAGV